MPGRRAEIAGQAVEDLAEPASVLLVFEREEMLEVAEGLRRAVAERDRFLDLEVERDPAVVDAALILDRHEREEALQLAGAPELLLLAQRSGAEALERGLDLAERGFDRCVVAVLGRRDEALEGRRGRGCVGRAALLLVGGGEQGEVPARESRRTRAADVEALAARGDHRVESRAEPRLVGVQEVGPDCRRCRLGAHPPGLERLKRERGVGAGTREARRLAELAHEEPGARLVDVAGSRGSRRTLERLGEDRRPRRGARDLHRDGILRRHGSARSVEARAGGGLEGPSSNAAAFATRFLALSGSPRTSARCASASVVRTSAAACQGS